MNITIVVYSFHTNEVIFKCPFEIERETSKCYFTKNARYIKSQLGIPVLKCPTSYPYVELVMVDADEETLITTLSQWFTDKAYHIRIGRLTL